MEAPTPAMESPRILRVGTYAPRGSVRPFGSPRGRLLVRGPCSRSPSEVQRLKIIRPSMRMGKRPTWSTEVQGPSTVEGRTPKRGGSFWQSRSRSLIRRMGFAWRMPPILGLAGSFDLQFQVGDGCGYED